VRQALRSALDYSRFSENSPFGPLLPASQFVSPGIVGFNPQITVPVHDPERARKLLAEAGYPTGIKVKVSFLSSSEAVFQELAQQLAPSGFLFEADPVDSTVLFDRMARCQTDMAVFGWICSTGDGGELLDGTFSHWSPEPASNAPCGYQNARLDELSQSASMALDPIERTAVLQQAMTLLTEELPWIPLFIPQDRYALSEELEWEPRPDAEVYILAVGLKSSKKSRK
jgi:peptide/nickel transport system substrate-binding protein